MEKRSDYPPALNALLRQLEVPDDEEPDIGMPNIIISGEDIPELMRGEGVLTVPNRETRVSFRFEGISAGAIRWLDDIIKSHKVTSYKEMRRVLEEFGR